MRAYERKRNEGKGKEVATTLAAKATAVEAAGAAAVLSVKPNANAAGQATAATSAGSIVKAEDRVTVGELA